jgi:AraC family transcriptional regulator of adaptative response/methylated-DNA-[protein]-cysteine methyltransferase
MHTLREAIGISESDAWERVVARDRSSDGVFYYAVKTTGIFCRPSCPSRRPKRQNVAFFLSPADAEQAGFRACYRCHPASEVGTPTERRVRRAAEYIDQHLDEKVTLERLAAVTGLSAFHLQRTFKDVLGMSPRAYQDARRLEAMRSNLQGGMEIGPAVWAAGYGSYRGAYESVAGGLGMTPGEYKNGARGIEIRYALHETGFGKLLVAWTPRGVCAVSLGEADEELVQELRAEFPAARLERDQETEEWVRPFIDYLDGLSPGLTIPVDAAGTAFQRRVWTALQEIPLGDVRSYSEVAEAIGNPTAARAVARACAANRTALIVPCHRVVRSDGSLGGYRWHMERKRLLLEHERALKQDHQTEA